MCVVLLKKGVSLVPSFRSPTGAQRYDNYPVGHRCPYDDRTDCRTTHSPSHLLRPTVRLGLSGRMGRRSPCQDVVGPESGSGTRGRGRYSGLPEGGRFGPPSTQCLQRTHPGTCPHSHTRGWTDGILTLVFVHEGGPDTRLFSLDTHTNVDT